MWKMWSRKHKKILSPNLRSRVLPGVENVSCPQKLYTYTHIYGLYMS